MVSLRCFSVILVLMLTTIFTCALNRPDFLRRAIRVHHHGSTCILSHQFRMTATDVTPSLAVSTTVAVPSRLSNARVLTCGDGDLSFTAALSQLKICKSIVASTWDSSERLLNSFEKAATNIDTIQCSQNGSVKYNVDATKLCDSFGSTSGDNQFDTILWNFPHVAGKQNIKRNRELVQNFLKSARELFVATGIGADGVVKVSLCGGQSGTKAGSMDDWNFSWQLCHQAAEAGFHLVQVEPFDEAVMQACFPGYGVQGHRGHGGNFPIGLGSQMFTFRLPQSDGCVNTVDSVDGVVSRREQTLQAPMYIHEVHLLADQLCTDLNVLEGRARAAVVDIISRHEEEQESHSSPPPHSASSSDSNSDGAEDSVNSSSANGSGDSKQRSSGSSSSSSSSSVWAVHLVDVYTCPRTHQVSHTFQVAYACTSLSARPVGRARADEFRAVVERELPLALGMLPRTVKHGGKVSMPYPWFVTAAVGEMAARPAQLWRQGGSGGVSLADVSSALRSMEGDRDGGRGHNELVDDGSSSGSNSNSGSGSTSSKNVSGSSGRSVEEEHIRAIARTLWRRRVGVLIHTAAAAGSQVV